jgi:hypothetical protein
MLSRRRAFGSLGSGGVEQEEKNNKQKEKSPVVLAARCLAESAGERLWFQDIQAGLGEAGSSNVFLALPRGRDNVVPSGSGQYLPRNKPTRESVRVVYCDEYVCVVVHAH